MGDLLAFYKEHLDQALLPFWMRAMDRTRGGVYTCFDNEGKRRVSTDKYTWSQGRVIWLLSRLASMCKERLIDGDAELYLDQAARTVRFLSNHVFMDNGNCAYLLSESGEMKESIPGLGHDISFYADCFVVLGFGEYAKAAADDGVLEQALKLYRTIEGRLRAGNVRSEPYPIPAGYEAHAVSMIMLNVSQELADVLEMRRHPAGAEIRERSLHYMEKIIARFLGEDHLVSEMVPVHRAGGAEKETLLERHIAPGHSLECMWFVMTEARKLGRGDILGKAAQAVKRAFEIGWDAEYGGLFRYVDCDGGEPRGRSVGDRYETLVAETWDMKIWWPHSEALYTLLLAYELTGEQPFMQMYEQTHSYVFGTFPNPDRAVGEWIQIRDRQGMPVQKLVALPVKDPYHIIRNVLLCIELLSGNDRAG